MCTGGCAKCLGGALLCLSTIAFLCDILLFFPGGKKIHNINHLSEEVWFFGGILGSGFMMLFPANMFLNLKHNDYCGCCGFKSCGKRFAMFSSIIFAVIGILGAGYSFIISFISIRKGPKCLMDNNEWGYPFLNGDYLNDKYLWSKCRGPENVISWNLKLFSILLVIAVIQIVLCAIQVVNGFLGTICINCSKGLTLPEHDSDVDTTLHTCQPHLTPHPSAAVVLTPPYMRSEETEAQRGLAGSPTSQSSSVAELALNPGHLAPELPPMPAGSPALSPEDCPSAALQLHCFPQATQRLSPSQDRADQPHFQPQDPSQDTQHDTCVQTPTLTDSSSTYSY